VTSRLRPLSLRERVLTGTALLAVVFGAAFLVLTRSVEDLRDAADQRKAAYQLAQLAAEDLRLVVDIETGIRGFVITRDTRFLEPYRRALTARRRRSAALVDATRGQPEAALAVGLRRQLEAYLRAYARPLVADVRAGRAAAGSVARTLDGKRRVDVLRAGFERLGAAAERRAQVRDDRAQAAARRSVALGSAFLVGSLLILVVSGVSLAGAVARPVRRVADAADRLAGGDRSAAVAEHGPEELARLGRSFNAMSAALDAQRAELVAAREASDEANAAKSQFLSRMSHELRTPLNAVLGFGQLLELEDLDASQREYVKQVLRGGRHLLELINEVLDIARVEAGRMALSMEPVALHEALEDVAAMIAPLAADREVGVEVRDVDPALHVMADRQRLRQVLINLVSNAVKYNRTGGHVTLAAAAAGGRAEVSVTDTGIGIPAASLERLFVPFERLGAERTDIEGTGLGLALSKRMVEAMGGTLRVASREGEGTTFTVDLAAADAPGAGEPDGEDRSAVRLGPDTRPTILYIEDNESNIGLVERIFERRSSVRLLVARTGESGIETAAHARPDLILLDLHLPDADGRDVLARVRAEPRLEGVPVVVLSADATPGQIARLLRAGATGYLTKPIDVHELLTTVGALTNGGEAARRD